MAAHRFAMHEHGQDLRIASVTAHHHCRRAALLFPTFSIRGTLQRAPFALIAAFSVPALAQDETRTEPSDVVVVTGSRIQNQDYVANSPLTTVSGEQATANQDITLDTFLNTLPQVNPSSTTT